MSGTFCTLQLLADNFRKVVDNIQIVRMRYFPGCEEKSSAAEDKALKQDDAAAQSCELPPSECRSQEENPADDDAGLKADLYIDLPHYQKIV